MSVHRSRQGGTELISMDLPLFRIENNAKITSERSVEKVSKVLMMTDSLHLSSAISEG